MARPKRKDKTRTVLRTGELQRSDGSYQYSWTDENHKRRYVYSKTLEALRIKEEHGKGRCKSMKLTEEIEEFINLTITEHMGKEYAEWKIKQQSVAEPDKVEEEYEKVIASLSPEQEEAITKYCDAIFSSGADTEEFFYRLGLKDGLKLRKVIKSILKSFS